MTPVDQFLLAAETVMESNEVEPNQDQIFDTLSNSRRRAAIRYLYASGGPVPVSDLVESITEEESAAKGSNVRERVRASVYSSLVQSHLPKMDNYGVVEYDSESQTVRLTDTGALLVPYIEHPSRSPTRWIAAYVILAVLMGAGGIFLQMTTVEILPVSTENILLISGMLLIGIACVHLFVILN